MEGVNSKPKKDLENKRIKLSSAEEFQPEKIKDHQKEFGVLRKDKDDIKMDSEVIRDKNNDTKVNTVGVMEQSVEELQSEKIKELQQQNCVLAKERDALEVDRDSLLAIGAKYKVLTNKLCEKVECPVCLEVPTSGPINICPNGHLVCVKCKQVNCPTCRSEMLGGNSLLAVAVIENIEHKCKHDGCEELLGMKDYQKHLDKCAHSLANRIVLCPAPRELCGKNMELSKIYDHILSECEGSWNPVMPYREFRYGILKNISTSVSVIAKKGIAVNCEGSHFYLGAAMFPSYTVFTIQHFGDKFECQKFSVDLSVDSDSRDGKNVQNLTCAPLSIDMDQDLMRTDGLMIGAQQMEKIAKRTEDGEMKIRITLSVKKL